MRDSLFQRASPQVLAALLALVAAGSARAQATDIDTAQPFYRASDLGVTVNPVFAGGVLKTDQAGATYGQGFTLDGSGTNTIDAAGVASTFSGTFSDAGGPHGGLNLTDSVGGGVVTLSGASTYTGHTTVSAGTLSLTGSILASSGVSLTGATAVLDMSNLGSSTEIQSLSGVAGSRVQLGAKGLTVNQASGTVFAGQIMGSGSSAFIKSGGGGLTLSGDNGYTNETRISAGVLALSGAGSIAASSRVVDDAIFDISATTSGASITSLAGTGAVALGGKTLTLTAAADTFDGTIAGTGGLTVLSGAETLTGANTYSGATTIDGGASLILTGAGSVGGSSGVVANGTFDISGAASGAAIASLSGSGHVVLGGQSLSVTQASGVFSGDISGAGGLSLSGGTLTLSGANSYQGGTSIFGGLLALTGRGSLGSTTGTLTLAGGALDLGGTAQTVGAVNLSGGRIIDSVGGGVLNAAAYDIQSGDVAVALGGSSGLTQAGTGTITLLRANTYTGLTTISGGTLALSGAGSISASAGVVDNGTFDISATNAGASITRLSGSGRVALGDRTLTLTRAADSFAGVIGGSGGLTVAGGAETLTGANTYGGATTIDPGAALYLAGGGRIAASSAVAVNGTFDISAAVSDAAIASLSGSGHVVLGGHSLTLTHSSGTFAGDISGAGGLALTGGGLTLAGTNSFTGGSRVTGGATLTAQSDAALGGPTGGVILDQGVLRTTGELNSNRTLTVAAGGGAIVADHGAMSLSGPILLSGALSASGRINISGLVQGPGVLSITDGLFSDNGVVTAGAVTVARDATLRGAGVVNAPTTVGGTLAPGNSPGTLTFNAPLTLQAGATLQLDIDGTGTGSGAGNFSRLIVNSGAFTAAGVLAPVLRGMTGSASNSYTPPIGQQFQVVIASGGVVGTFTGLNQPTGLAAGTRFDALYAPTTLTLVVTPVAYADLGAAETANQKAAGAVLDAGRPAAGLRMTAAQAAIYDPLYRLSAAQIPVALDGLSPAIYADGLMAARRGWYDGAAAVGDQLAQRRGASGSNGVTAWGAAFGRYAEAGPTGAGYHTRSSGLIVGVDKTFDGGLVGLAVSANDLNTRASGGGQAEGTLVQAAIYGQAHRGRLFLEGQADYLHMDQDLARAPGLGGAAIRGGDTLSGGGLQINLSLDMTLRQWRVEPTVGLSALTLTSTATQEASNAAMAETIAGERTTSLQSFAGLRFARSLRLASNTPVQVRGLLGWSHEMADTQAQARASLASLGGASFTVASAPLGRDAARLGAGFDAGLTSRVTLYGSYSAALARDDNAQDLTLGVRLRW